VTDGEDRSAPWKPTLVPGADLRSLPLTPEEGFVASRLDGTTDVHGLSVTTGLPAGKVEAALEKLVSLGAVAPRDEPENAEGDDEPPTTDVQPLATGADRQLYESRLKDLPVEERAARAKAAEEPELSAFCFDPLPAVIHALVENPRFGPAQARLVAAHHRNPAGLDALSGFFADAGVRRALLRNPQLPATLLRRLQTGRRLLEQHKLVVSRDVPEQTRRAARELLRARFPAADAEERVELILKTEGRCLASLAGVPVDAKTAALLGARTYTSTLLVQNLARWSACPPSLLAQLLKQEIVRRSPQLRLLVQRHPNAPGEKG